MIFKNYQVSLIKIVPSTVSDTFFALLLIFYLQALVKSQNKRMKQLEKNGKCYFLIFVVPVYQYRRGMYPQQWDRSNINQSAFSSLDWEITSQSELYWVAYKRNWEFPINMKIFLIPIHPLHFNTLTLTHTAFLQRKINERHVAIKTLAVFSSHQMSKLQIKYIRSTSIAQLYLCCLIVANKSSADIFLCPFWLMVHNFTPNKSKLNTPGLNFERLTGSQGLRGLRIMKNVSALKRCSCTWYF